ncbi:MAG: TylF/MycF/NovP-related O-methyltransferase [Planctomycetota bacterium]|jgi:hypothetical protein
MTPDRSAENATMELNNFNAAKHTPAEKSFIRELREGFENSSLPIAQRLHNFPRHVRRQDIARFLAKYELFRKVLQVNGSIAECGVYAGGGLMSWMHFSAILEPYNHTRRIIGFDTFEGFPGIHANDAKGTSKHLRTGELSTTEDIQQEIEHLIALHDSNRPLSHIPKAELVRGDACKTIPRYVQDHQHLLVSMIYLDFDLYEPTLVALRELYPRVPEGGIVAFDELNCEELPGVTTALLEALNLDNVALQRFAFDPYIAYFVK